MKQVGTFGAMAEAQIAKSFLRSHGIDAELPDEHTLALSAGFDVALGWYRLFVPNEQAYQAAALLRDAAESDPGAPVCEHCGGRALSPIRSWALPCFLAVADKILPFGPPTGDTRCRRCGHEQAAAPRAAVEKEPA